MKSGRSAVLVKSCAEYDPVKLAECVRQCLEFTDPDRVLVAPGRKVLLKVNMLSAKGPEKAVTTHPALIEAVARECIARGAEVLVGDSPAGAEKGIAHFWEKTGIGDAAENAGAQLVNFESAGTFYAEIGGTAVHITNAVRDADTIINMPKLKTHGLTMMTAAVKNLYGVLPGFQKGTLHVRIPRVDNFSRFLVQLYRFVAPAITIVDAITVMEGNGPASGNPKDVGLIIAGSDAEAVDCVAADVMGFGPGDVPTIYAAAEAGGVLPEDVDVRGDSHLIGSVELMLPGNLRSVRIQGWLLVHLPDVVFGWIGKVLWLVPETTPACTLCEKCVQGCPKEAMVVRDGKVVVDRALCVTCLRCQEICLDGAIRLKRSPLLRLLRG